MGRVADGHAAGPVSVEEQFSDGSERAVVCWRYDWGDGYVRGVDIVRVRNGQLAESLAYVKGQRDATEQLFRHGLGSLQAGPG